LVNCVESSGNTLTAVRDVQARKFELAVDSSAPPSVKTELQSV
jgi:hypothetical protein